MDRFYAIDVETSNPALSSICQIGLVGFEDGKEFQSENWIIDPNDWFDPINVSIHGINEKAVSGAPGFPEIHSQLYEILRNEIVVSHTHFDRSALSQATAKYSINNPDFRWLDSAKVARRCWDQFAKRGYGLANLAAHCGIIFKHHDANEDARAAGEILLRAIEDSGVSLEDWLGLQKKGISTPGSIKRLGDGDGQLTGETVCFTGALTIPRKVAADKASSAGADVSSSVGRKTTILVVGDQDISRLAGKMKGSKHLKAEKLISGGQNIRIIGETDFLVFAAIKS